MFRPVRLSLVLASSTALALAACGSDDGGSGSSTAGASGADDREAISATVTGYAKAFAGGDVEKACGYLSQAGRKQVEAAADQLHKDGCAGVLEAAADELGDEASKTLGSLRVTSYDIRGDHATITTSTDGQKGGNETSTLVKEDGEWKIAPDKPAARATAQTVTAPRPTAQTVTAP
jgi:ketosteroid isomerase-like protein